MTRTDSRPDPNAATLQQVASGAVIVGVDDADGGRGALDWAAREAAARHVSLRLVRTYFLGLRYPWIAAEEQWMTAELKEAATRVVDRAAHRVAEIAPEVDVATDVHEGDPVHYLVRHADRAGVIVLGSHHLGALGRAVLGSVSASVAARASCPVVVVSSALDDVASAIDSKVVVGVDPMHDPGRVLAFAFDYASRHEQQLHPVMSWHVDAFADARWPYELRRVNDAKRWLAEAVAGWEERYPDVVVRKAVTHEQPVAALVGTAQAWDLVVVGRHGFRARYGRLLGSTSQGVLHHATCPVAVVASDD